MNLSKKKLKELAESLNAYYYGGNVYNYEEALHVINNINRYGNIEDIENHFKDTEYHNRKELRELLISYAINEDVSLFNNMQYRLCVAEQIAYSYGIYGSTGQLHKVIITDIKTDEIVKTFFIYYC